MTNKEIPKNPVYLYEEWSLICPMCRHTIVEKYTYCPECGQRLRG